MNYLRGYEKIKNKILYNQQFNKIENPEKEIKL